MDATNKYEVYLRSKKDKRFVRVGVTDGDAVTVTVDALVEHEFYVESVGRKGDRVKSEVCSFIPVFATPTPATHLMAYEQPAIEREEVSAVPDLPDGGKLSTAPDQPADQDDDCAGGFDALEAMLLGAGKAAIDVNDEAKDAEGDTEEA